MWKQCRQLACRFAMWESMFLRVWRFKLTAGDKNTWRDGRKNWGSAPLKGMSQDWEVYPLNSASPWYLVTWVLGVIWGKMFFGPPPGGKNKPISSKSYCSTSTSHQSNIESIMFFIYKKTPHLPFIGPKSCAVAMNLNLSGGSSVGSAVLMCILRSVKHIADRSWEK